MCPPIMEDSMAALKVPPPALSNKLSSSSPAATTGTEEKLANGICCLIHGLETTVISADGLSSVLAVFLCCLDDPNDGMQGTFRGCCCAGTSSGTSASAFVQLVRCNLVSHCG